MLLAVDTGNTQTHIGIFRKESLVAQASTAGFWSVSVRMPAAGTWATWLPTIWSLVGRQASVWG